MNDIIGKFAVIIAGIIFVFFIPVTIIALKQDNVAQSYIDNAVVEFVDNSRASARITPEAYEKMLTKIYAVCSPCEIEIWHSAKYIEPGDSVIGPGGMISYKEITANEDFSKEYILEFLDQGDDYILKNGDYLKVMVKNAAPTLGARLAGVLLPGYNKNSIFASYGGFVGNDLQ